MEYIGICVFVYTVGSDFTIWSSVVLMVVTFGSEQGVSWYDVS